MKLKGNVNKVILGVVYVVACIVFIYSLATGVNELNLFAGRYFNPWANLLSRALPPFVFSVVFSFEHLKNIFTKRDKKLKVNVPQIVVALLLLFIIVSFMFQITMPSAFRFLYNLYFLFQGPVIIHFAFWYNVLRVVSRSVVCKSSVV